MPFPQGWPPRISSGQTTIRFYVTGTASTLFEDSAHLFIDGTGANPYTPLPQVRPGEDVSAPDSDGPHEVSPNPAGTGENDPGSPKAMIWSKEILVVNNDGTNAIEFSFDGVNVHGRVEPNSERKMFRQEAGIAIRGVAGTPAYRVEAW